MSGLKNLETRLKYRGGAKQVDRMIADKARSLKGALNLSYQSATAVLSDGREFKCLINPNKLSMESDDKVLSIPFEDICLNNETIGSEPIGVKCGDVIEWKETETHWIIYTQYLQEIAYFRGQMRQCEKEPLIIENKQFYYYVKGPSEEDIDWQKSKHFILNNLNYNIEIYISKAIETKQLFHRFNKVKIPFKNSEGKIEYRPYEVQAIDDISMDGVLAVYLKEDFNNEWEKSQSDESLKENIEQFKTTPIKSKSASGVLEIHGPAQVYPYDTVQYKVLNDASGSWSLSNKRAVIREQNNSCATVEITSGKSGNVSLIYKADGFEDVVFNIEILSL